MRLSVVVGGVVLAAAAAGLGAPYWVGIQTQKYYEGVVHDAANRYGFDAKDAVYHRGWFASDSRIKFKIPADKAGEKPYVISAVTKIHHGPVVFGVSDRPVIAASVAVTTFEFPRELDAPLHHYFGDRPPVRLTTTVDFDGGSKTHIFSPVYKGPSQDGKLTVNWKGMVGDSASTVTPQGEKVTSHFNAPGLVIEGQGGKLEIKSLDASGGGNRVQSGLLLGHGKMSVAMLGLDLSSPKSGKVHFLVNGLSFSDDVAPKGHMLTMKVGSRVKDIELDDQHYGPGQYDMEVRNLGEHVVTEYVKTMRDVRDMRSQGAHNAKAMAALGGRLLGLANEFLKNSPQLEISRVSLGTNDGDVKGSLLVTFDGQGSFDVRNLPLLMPRVHGEANVEVPEMLFKTIVAGVARSRLTSTLKANGQEVPDETTLTTSAMSVMDQEIQSMMDKGFIVNEDGRYTAKLVFDKGHMTVNGRPMGSQGL